MKPLEEVVGRVVQMRTPSRSVVPAGAAPTTIELPPELASEADLQAGGIRFGDMVMSQPNPRFHPDAERYAAQIRAALAPASIEQIRGWLTDLVKRLAPGPIAAQDLFEALVDTCGDMPALCWSAATRREVTRRHKFLPVVSELSEVLDSEARKWRGRAAAFERMAEAKPEPEPDWRALPAPERPADLPKALPPRRRPLRERGDEDFDPEEAKLLDDKARQAVTDQLAALGYTRDTVPPLKPRTPDAKP